MIFQPPFLPPMSSDTESRRGAVLLVVISMLTLFAVVGLSFVFYANAEAIAARTYREAVDRAPPTVDPELAFAYFLNQLLFDVHDDALGVQSAVRGLSILRNMYGLNTTYSGGSYFNAGNSTPWNGVGRLHEPSPWANDPSAPPEAKDLFNFINYTYFSNYFLPAPAPPGSRFLRDPERLSYRNVLQTSGTVDIRGPFTGGFNAPYTYFDHNTMFLAAVKSDGTVLLPSFHRPWLGFGSLDPSNPNWTEPDVNKPWLKYMVLRPRPADHPPMGTRPGFPPTKGPNGDVQNLIGGPDGPDSFWMDLGAPVMRTPDGRKYKMMFAPLIMCLDSKINLNVHGNILGKDAAGKPVHLSNHSPGPWSINLSRVLNSKPGIPGFDPQEWVRLFTGMPHTGTTQFPGPPPLAALRLSGKYGKNQFPGDDKPVAPPTFLTGLPPHAHFYAQLDRDDVNVTSATGAMQLPVGTGLYPVFPPGYDNNNQLEKDITPSRYRYAVTTPTTDGWDRKFALCNMEKLWRFGDTNHELMNSELMRLCAGLFADPDIRRKVTLLSGDRNAPGAMPWSYGEGSPPGSFPNQYGSPNPQLFPVGTPIPFPQLGWRTAPGTPAAFYRGPNPNAPAEFGSADWRSTLGAQGVPLLNSRADLNRINTLSQFPLYVAPDPKNPSERIQTDVPIVIPPSTTVPPTHHRRFDEPGGKFGATFFEHASSSAFRTALAARQSLANALYRRLLRLAAVPGPANPWNPTDTELVARRWLAQLAVNIVDYIDEDDISTPFNFYTATDAGPPPSPLPPSTPFDIAAVSNNNAELPRYWVFGTELPRVVINEVIAEYREPSLNPKTGDLYLNKFWVELYNPMQDPDPTKTKRLQKQDGFSVRLHMEDLAGNWSYRFVQSQFPNQFAPLQGPSSAYPIYKIVMATGMANRPDNDNVMGQQGGLRNQTTDVDVSQPAQRIDNTGPQPPAPGQPGKGTPHIRPQEFLLFGPPGPDETDSISVAGGVPPATPIVRTPSMQDRIRFVDDVGGRTPDYRRKGVTVLLRRLANPHIPYDPNPKVEGINILTKQLAYTVNPWYNPYVTIDYLEDVPLNNATPTSFPPFQSRVKRQPYAGAVNDLLGAPIANGPVTVTPLPPPPPMAPYPDRITYHSMGKPNLSLTGKPLTQNERYDWLVHLDRHLISPIELLHVSAYQPHQLTQRFITGDNRVAANRFNHYAPWLDERTRIYRLFEFVQARQFAQGDPIRGAINLNTILDREMFHALCDWQPSSNFTQRDVDDIYDALMLRRTPALSTIGPGPNDRPILSLATGVEPPNVQHPEPSGRGINNTVLQQFGGPDPRRRLFQPPIPRNENDPASHPYIQYELLNKIYNHVTNRSNVFAVWVTVGFFEVNDENQRPVRLGAELGSAEGRQVRHRMFAIVDRSTMFSNPGPQPRFDPHAPTVSATLVPYFAVID